MLRRKQKAQGMTEFALILPLLLLLLLGIIEAGRVIWAFVTVQQAAREAARFAVTGRPFANIDDGALNEIYQINVCQGENPEPNQFAPGSQPWLCEPEDRVEAIKRLASARGKTLNVSRECLAPSEFFGDCAQTPGAFGVLVRGQHIEDLDTNEVLTTDDHPGTEGLNVEILTFYNIEMITPVYDVVMGGNFLTLRGGVQLQNEGIDAAIGIEPPPGIAGIDPGSSGEVIPPTGTYRIWAVSYTGVEQSDPYEVILEKHPTGEGPFDIWLRSTSGGATYRICANVPTDSQGESNDNLTCSLLSVPAGLYDLFSTPDGVAPGDAFAAQLALAPEQVEVVVTLTPKIQFTKGTNVWAANSVPELQLLGHEPVAYELHLFAPDNSQLQTIQASYPGNGGPFDWNSVPDTSVCDFEGGTPCLIRSYKVGQYLPGTPAVNMVAATEVYINQPKLVLSPAEPYKQGTTLRVFLDDHTPNESYEVWISGGPNNVNENIGLVPDTNAFGDSAFPTAWVIPSACAGSGGWPDGKYTITSRTPGGPVIATVTDVDFQTPAEPYIEVDGGADWPAGALIRIEAFNHAQMAEHYMEFDGDLMTFSNGDTLFETNSCGYAAVDFVIPADTPPDIYDIDSFVNVATQPANYPANYQLTVILTPFITVLEGNQALLNDIITIQLTNHRRNFGYQVIYADKVLFEVLTDNNGQATVSYDLSNLPFTPGPNFNDPSNLGVFFDMYSKNLVSNATEATTQLALEGADLEVTMVEFPPLNQIQINSMVPVSVTVRNNNPVPINGYFDVDLYFNPSPINPSYYTGYNFPGDIKHWQNSVAPAGQPGDTFVVTEQFFVGNYGLQTLHGFADTSNFVPEGESGNQVANANNLLANSFNLTCTPTRLVETFNSLPAWGTARYGDADLGSGATISAGRLRLNNDGSSTWQSNDNSGGELFYYRTTPVATTSIGFDVEVQLINIDKKGVWSKAGIEIRNAVDNTQSPRVVLGVAREDSGSNFVIQPGYRDGGGMNWAPPGDNFFRNNHEVNLGGSNAPVWLRVEREPNTNKFNYYYRQTNETPPADPTARATWWGAPLTSVTVNGMAENLFVGLFHSPYANGPSGVGNAYFDNFSVTDPATCEPGQGSGETSELPPGLTLCSDPIQHQSFEESPTKWVTAFSEGVTRAPGQANSGNFKIKAPSFAFSSTNPWFFQKFVMPSWVLSTTTAFELNLAYNIDNQGTDQAQDQFYAVVTSNSGSIANAIASSVTTPTVVANGVGSGGPTNWTPFKATLPIINPSSLESLAEQELYLFFYANNNPPLKVPSACPGGCKTNFHFDDVNLSPCTTQPLPDPIETRLTGDLTLNFSGGSSQQLPYVKVWAYAQQGNEVYETLTLPGGVFNFYNLPATPAGTEYLIFSQYHLVDEFDPSQIETLSAETRTIIKQGIHTNIAPQRANLDLVTLSPIP